MVQSSDSYYAQQQSIAVLTVASAKKLWKGMTDDFASSWREIRPAMTETLQLGRSASIASSLGYTAAALKETGQVAAPLGALVPERFLETAPNGFPVEDTLDGAVIHAKVAVGHGSSAADALASSEKWLTGVLLTMMADTGRSVVGADIAQRPALGGYVRMLNAPSCSRCVILAGKWFKWNEGFLRHPRCDCRHIPASEDVAGDLSTDPYAYFHSLSKDEQAAVFGKSEARAVRDGGDIYRVVNIKQNGLATAKGRARFGTPSRLTVDDIYRTAGTRTNALRMLEQEGYITGPQVRGGNILGNGPAAQGFGQFGKGGKARAATDAVLKANADGVRDPLNRYTMTAAERRLFDAKTRLDVGKTGIWPQSIGQNTADKFVRPLPITPVQLETLRRNLQNQLDKLPDAAPSVQSLAKLLGL
jgi:hypothetical protein